jgi:quercetin dioxygenase-like cupin family protein
MMAFMPAAIAQLFAEGIRHHFAGGVYMREQTLEAGREVEKHVHAYDHLSYLASGSASVEIDGSLQTLVAPAVLVVKAGQTHRIQALTDIVWLCIHAESLADAETLNRE